MPNSSTKENIRPIIAISLLTAACLVGDSMLYIVLPTHWQEAGLSSLWEVGILLSANRLVRLPLNPIVGWLYNNISTRTGVLLASILAVLTTLSYGILQNFWLLLLSRCVWGLAWTFLRLGAYFTILNYSDDGNRGHFMGTYNGLFRLGSLIGMLGGGLLADSYGLTFTSAFFAAVTFICIPLIFIFVPSHTITCRTPQDSNWQQLHNSSVKWALLTGLIIAMVYQGMFNSTLSYLIKSHESESITIGNILIGAASLGGLLQAIRWGWEPWIAPWFGRLSDRTSGREPVLCVTLLIAVLLFLIIPFPMSLPLWLLFLCLLQLTATAATTVADAIAADAAMSSAKAVIMTAYSFAIDLGAALGPIIAYSSGHLWGPYVAFRGAAAILLLLLFYWYRSFHSRN